MADLVVAEPEEIGRMKRLITILFLVVFGTVCSAKIYSVTRLTKGDFVSRNGDTVWIKNHRTENIDTILFSKEIVLGRYEKRKEDRVKTSMMGYLSLLICVGFFINFIPFIRWVKKQKPTMELSLYQVRGKFTFFNVIAWIEVMEHSVGYEFKEERRKMSLFYQRALKRGKPFAIYANTVNEYLYMKSFGNSPRSIALKRMKLYPRVVYIWTLLLFFAPINYAVWYWKAETGSYAQGLATGFFAGLIPGWFLWGVGRMIMNSVLINVGNSWIRKRGDAGYLHELMHQFTGVHASYWAPLDWEDTWKTKISGLDGTDYTMGNINFKDSPQGGSQGSW